ncbi:hypothetical protein Tco_0809309 [Tanacetum coccineum]
MEGLQCKKFRGDKVKIILKLVIRVMLLNLGETMQVDRQGLLNATTIKGTEDLDTYYSDCDVFNGKRSHGQYFQLWFDKAQWIKPTLYDGIVIFDKHVAMPVIDDEETLILEEFRISNPIIESSDKPPIKVEVPSELPKKRTTPNAHTEGEWGFEHTKAVFNNEIIPFLKSLKDIFNVFDKDLLNEITEVQTVLTKWKLLFNSLQLTNNVWKLLRNNSF